MILGTVLWIASIHMVDQTLLLQVDLMDSVVLGSSWTEGKMQSCILLLTTEN
jgi:hypothetical protein